MIRIALSDTTVRNGEHVKGSVTWEAEGKTPRKIEVACRWRVEGRGRTREEIVASHESHESVIPFDFEIPKEGPLTYHGGRVQTSPRIYLVFWGSQWTGNVGEGYAKGGELYCCRECAESASCTCREAGPA